MRRTLASNLERAVEDGQIGVDAISDLGCFADILTGVPKVCLISLCIS